MSGFIKLFIESAEGLGLAGLDAAGHVGVLEPHGDGGGVVDGLARHREVQTVEGLHVIVNFNISGVPDIIAATQLLAGGLHQIPVVVGIKLVGVTPNAEEPGGIPNTGLAVDEVLHQIHEAGILVVDGGRHTEPVGGNGEIDGGLGGTGVGDTVVAENVHGHIVIGTHGVGATADDAAEDLLQYFPVLGDLVVGDGTGHTIQEGMGVAVDGDLVVLAYLATVGLLGQLVAHAATDGALGVGELGLLHELTVDIERTLQAVLVKDLHQADILLHAVVVGEGQGLHFSLGEKHSHHHGCLFLSFLSKMRPLSTKRRIFSFQ